MGGPWRKMRPSVAKLCIVVLAFVSLAYMAGRAFNHAEIAAVHAAIQQASRFGAEPAPPAPADDNHEAPLLNQDQPVEPKPEPAPAPAPEPEPAVRPPARVATPPFLPAIDPSAPDEKHTVNCSLDLGRLAELRERYGLGEKMLYLKRYVAFSPTREPRASLTQLQQPLFPAAGLPTIDLGANAKTSKQSKAFHAAQDACTEPLRLSVPLSPSPGAANLSDFMFGISTTYERVVSQDFRFVYDWTYWLTDGRGRSNGATLLLTLDDASDADRTAIQGQIRATGIDVDVMPGDDTITTAARFLRQISDLYNHPVRPTRRWLVVCDDDTYFPNPNALVAQLARLDADQARYVGTLSEDLYQMLQHGSQAFGGAGVFLSVPMAELLTDKIDKCLAPEMIAKADTHFGPQGDVLLRNCIYDNSDVRLTVLSDLWQLDLCGDPGGFYEQVTRPLSLHHFSGGPWHNARPYQSTRVAYACGEACVWQRFLFAPDSHLLANGFSLVAYPAGTANIYWDQVERTFSSITEDKGDNFDYSLGPQRPSLNGSGRKLAWLLMEADVRPDGAVVQVYVLHHDDPRWYNAAKNTALSPLDSIVELVWVAADRI